MAQAIFRRDLDVITHTYCERVAAHKLRQSKGTDEVSTEELLSETQQIWGNADWLPHIDAFCARMINKNKAGAQPRPSSPNITPPPSPTADIPLPPSPTAAPQERSPPSTATTSTPTLNKPVAETPIPSALK